MAPQRATRLTDFMYLSRPHVAVHSLPPLKDESRKCLRRLASYKTPKSTTRYPRTRSAGVLVALFVDKLGDLRVLLSRRSDTLRTYAGDTSLPGGKVERHDRNIEDTARREAFEEIGLSLDKHKVPLLCILEPFLAGNQLIVTPVVVLILDTTVRPVLNAPEVHSLFSQPLVSFLRTEAPFRVKRAGANDTAYHTYTDVPWPLPDRVRTVRMHRFLTGRESEGVKPVFGLTAAILIKVASIGFACEPEFATTAPEQPTMTERIAYALQNEPKFIEALEEEEDMKSHSSTSAKRRSVANNRPGHVRHSRL